MRPPACLDCGAELPKAAQPQRQLKRCGECRKALRRKVGRDWWANNRDHHRAYQNNYRYDNPAKSLLYAARRRAKAKDLPFDIDESDIRVPPICPVLNIPLTTGTGVGHENAPSLDRIDPRLGYVRGNIAVISSRANRIKQDATPAEVMAVALWMQETSTT